LRDLGFVLYGGTAVALNYGHRISSDFDFFSSNLLTDYLKLKIKSLLHIPNDSFIIQDTINTLNIVTYNNVNITLFGGLTFGRIGTPELTDDNILLIASKYDLLMTKLKVIMQRSDIRDYIDIAILLNDGLDLSVGLAANVAIYNDNFSCFHCLKALTFYFDGSLETLDTKYQLILIEHAKKVDSTKLPKVPIISKNLAT
jgi:hypothetical protein